MFTAAAFRRSYEAILCSVVGSTIMSPCERPPYRKPNSTRTG